MAKIQDIFDKNLDSVLSEGANPDLSLERDPATAEIKPLLDLAVACRSALEVDVPEETLLEVKARVMAKARELKGARQPVQRVWNHSRFVLRPVALAAGLLALSTGTAFAANAAGPDSILYPVKQKLEDARGAIASQPLDRAAVATGNAGKRLDEIQGMVDKGQPAYVSDLLSRYDSQIADAQRLTDDAAGNGEDVSAVTGMISATLARHDAILSDIKDKVPDDVRAAIEEEEARSGSMSGDGGAGPGTDDGQQMMTPGGATAPAGDESAHDGENSSNAHGGDMPSQEGPSEPSQPPASGSGSQGGMEQSRQQYEPPAQPQPENPSPEQSMSRGGNNSSEGQMGLASHTSAH